MKREFTARDGVRRSPTSKQWEEQSQSCDEADAKSEQDDTLSQVLTRFQPFAACSGRL